MHFEHSAEMWREFPELVAGAEATVSDRITRYHEIATELAAVWGARAKPVILTESAPRFDC